MTFGRKFWHLLQPMKVCTTQCSFHQSPSASKLTRGYTCYISKYANSVQGRQFPHFRRSPVCITYESVNMNLLFHQNLTIKCPHQCSQMRNVHMQSTTVKEEVTLENLFSDSNRQRVQDQLHTVKPVRSLEMMGVKKQAKVSAVLVPLCMVDREPSVLFTLRSSSLRKHRGEVR